MRFILDTQLSRALVRPLREAGHEALHVLDLGLAQSSDRVIAMQARSQDAVVMTKDEDFVGLAGEGLCVLWIRLGNCPNDVLIDAVTRALPIATSRFAQGECLVEVG